jgi:hypothetical protein
MCMPNDSCECDVYLRICEYVCVYSPSVNNSCTMYSVATLARLHGALQLLLVLVCHSKAICLCPKAETLSLCFHCFDNTRQYQPLTADNRSFCFFHMHVMRSREEEAEQNLQLGEIIGSWIETSTSMSRVLVISIITLRQSKQFAAYF